MSGGYGGTGKTEPGGSGTPGSGGGGGVDSLTAGGTGGTGTTGTNGTISNGGAGGGGGGGGGAGAVGGKGGAGGQGPNGDNNGLDAGGAGGMGGAAAPQGGGLGGSGQIGGGAAPEVQAPAQDNPAAVGSSDNTSSAGGGGGGGGADGFVGAGLPTNASTGGNGGAGGGGNGFGAGGGGGAGGDGAVVTNAGSLGPLTVSVIGGAGGMGGSGYNGTSGAAGTSGDGLLFTDTSSNPKSLEIANGVTVQGGQAPQGGSGAAGIAGSGVRLLLDATASVKGGSGANSIMFTGGFNTLTFSSASSSTNLTGNIGVSGSSTTLAITAASGGTVLDTAVVGTAVGTNAGLDLVGGLVGSGDGPLTLKAANTFSGQITMEEGAVLVDGSTVAASPVTVLGGATLGGGGTVSGSVTVDSGGTITASAVNSGSGYATSFGTLTTGALTLDSGATLHDYIVSPGSADLIEAAGAVSVSGTLDLEGSGPFTTATGQSITLIDNTSTAATTGQFAQVEVDGGAAMAISNNTFTANGRTYQLSYTGGTGGNDVVMTDVTAGTPTANSQSDTTAFNTAKAITLTGSDPDNPPQSLTYKVTSAPTHGTLSGTAPNLTYTPTPGYSGADSFTFTDNNGTNTSTPATVSINVTPGTPTANAQSDTTAFDTAKAITLTGTDPDSPARTLTYAINTEPTNGTLSNFNPNTGAVTYTPNTGYDGSDSFTFTDNNGTNTSRAATVSLTVAAGTPTAYSQSDSTPYDTATQITLMGSDPDNPPKSLTYTITTAPSHGTLSGTAPNLTYTPVTGYDGSDSFTFTDNNGTNTSTPAIVSISVEQPVPPAPVITTPANNTDTNNQEPTFSGTGAADGTINLVVKGATTSYSYGGISVDPAGNWTYTPSSPLPDGSYTVTATESNGSGTSAPSNGDTFTIDTTPPTLTSFVADDPTPTNASTVGYTVTFSKPVTGVDTADFSLDASDTDNAASIASVTPVAGSNGASYTVTVNTGGAGNNGTIQLDLTGATIKDDAGNGYSGGVFQTQATYAVGGGPTSVAFADLNGDGRPDLVVVDDDSGQVSVLLGNGNGTFGAATTYAVGSEPSSVAVADLNGDGKPDLVVTDGGENTVSVLPGSDNGTFGAATTYNVGIDPTSVAIADLTGDGKPDLVVANAISDTVSVLTNNGDGTFETTDTVSVGKLPTSVAVADLNGDGKPDLVVANEGSNTISVLTGIGNGTFEGAITYEVGPNPTSVAIADLNGDGEPDLVVANEGNNTVSVLMNKGDGTFGAATSYATGSGPRSVAVADVNDDGKPDLVVADQDSNQVSVLPGNGDGTFGTATNYAVGSEPLSVAVTDVNGDGRPDIAVTNDGANTVSVLLNGPQTVQGPVYTLDTTAPTITGVTLGEPAYGLGSTVTATIQLSGTYDGNGAYTLGAGSTIDGAALTAGTYNQGSNTLTASFQVTANTNEVIEGNVPVDVTVDDAVGNPSAAYTTPVPNETIDTHAPTAVSVAGFTNSPSDDTGKSPAAAGSTVGALSTTDASPGDMFTYTLGGADKGDFTIANNTLEVGNTALTDGTVYNLTVTSSDLGQNQYTQTVQVEGATTPTVTSIVPAGMNPTNSASDPFTVTFSQSVQGVTAANFNLTGTDRNGTIGTPTTADGGTTWTVPVTGVSGNGALGLELYNPNGIASTSTDTPLADETTESDPDYTIDTTPPTVYPASLTVTENSGPTPIGIQAPSDTEPYTVTAASLPTDGTVTLSTGGVVYKGETLSTAQLMGLEFAPTPDVAGQTSTFTYTVLDQAGNSANGTATLGIYGNPAIIGLADSTTNLQAPTQPFASATVSDATQGATDSVTIALSGAAGTLSGAGLTTNPNGTYTLGSASPATVTQELDALTFTPSPADGGPIETTNFALTVRSSTGASSMASVTSTIDSYPNQPLFGSTTTSTSSVGGEVYALYQTILGRAPDALGFETQVAAVEAGASLDSVAQGLLSSAEYASDYGSTVASNAGFINQLYEDGLHRPADAGGQQLFGSQLANGTSRAEVAVEIATSPESSNDLAPTFAAGVFVPDASDSMVARLYYGLLNRAPDAAGLQADENAVHAGTSIGQVIQSFLGSAEYQTTTVGQDNLAYIENLYQTVLGRQGDAAGLQLYENGLDTGSLSRANVADAFLTSSEFQTDEAGQSNASYVNAVFEAALGRAADPNGSTYWQSQLNDGVSRSQVAQDIVGSSEFASKVTAAGQAEFVQALYEGALGRAPAASETQAWQAQLSNGSSLATVAASIVESPEAAGHLALRIEAGYHIS